MRTINSTQAKAKLGALLNEVERTGISITITSHGRAVAVLTPAPRLRGRCRRPPISVAAPAPA